jgi:hypothetical protein
VAGLPVAAFDVTPAEHYAEAEKLLVSASEEPLGSQSESYMIAAAQVHATLARVDWQVAAEAESRVPPTT